MSKITSRQRTVYRSPSSGRDYLTLRAACLREASRIVEAKYTTEPSETVSSGNIIKGWHFTEDDKLVALRDRVAKILRKKYVAST